MSNGFHTKQNAWNGLVHPISKFHYSSSVERLAASGFTAYDEGIVAWQKSDDTFWVLKTPSPAAWIPIASGSGGGSSVVTASWADVSASYVTISATGSLPNERVLAVGSGLSLTDGGAGSSVTLDLSPFNKFQLTQISTVSASYLTMALTGALPNERVLTAGTGLILTDGGAGSTATFAINNGVVATVSGTNFSGPVIATGGLTGSLQKLANGNSFLVAGDNVTITSGSGPNGQVVISATGGGGSGGGADPLATYVVISTTGSLANERALAAGTGLTLTDGGGGGAVTLGINNNVIATVSGTNFSGPVVGSGGLTGSLQRLPNGNTYLVAGPNISITSGSGVNGQIIISNTSPAVPVTASWADVSASYVVIGTTGSLPNERALAAGTGLILTDAGAGGNVTLGINDNVVATVSGSRFTGNVIAATGLTGSLQKTAGGLNYLVSDGTLTWTTSSNGQVTGSTTLAQILSVNTSAGLLKIQSLGSPATSFDAANKLYVDNAIAGVGGGGGADVSASYVLIGNTGSLPNERALTFGASFTTTDGGAGSTYTVGLNNNLVAFVSGTNFSGPVIATGGVTGSLQRLPNGNTYLVGGQNVTVTSGSGVNGQVVVSAFDAFQSVIDAVNYNLTISPTSSFSYVRVNSSTAPRIITLPSSTIGIGRRYTVVDANAASDINPITIRPTGTDKVAGIGQFVFDRQFDAATFVVDAGFNWDVLYEGPKAITGSGIKLMAAGGATQAITIDNNVVATVSGTRFTGPVTGTKGFESTGSYVTTAGNGLVVSGSREIGAIFTIASGSGATERGYMETWMRDTIGFAKVQTLHHFRFQTNTAGSSSIGPFAIGPGEHHRFTISVIAVTASLPGNDMLESAYAFSARRRSTGAVAQWGLTNPIVPLQTENTSWSTGYVIDSANNRVVPWIASSIPDVVNWHVTIGQSVRS